MKLFTTLGLSLVFVAVGCGGTSKSPNAPNPNPSPDPTMMSGGDTLEPPPVGQGFQYLMSSTINPGQEIERCRFFMSPPEGFYIKAETVRYSMGSHHVLLYQTPYTSIPTKSIRGADIDTSDVFDCAEGATADWQVTGVLAGSQSFNGKGIINEMPDGIAVQVPGNVALLLNTHYLNATPSALDATARINVYTTPKESVVQEAGVLFFYNPFIRVKANSMDSAEMRCPIAKDITLVSVQSHMHRRGVGYFANLLESDGSLVKQFYTDSSWEAVNVEEFQPGLQIKAGQILDYDCNYNNTESRDIMQGFSTKDEMCMLVGPYYPLDHNLENCRDEQGRFQGTWVGHGTASCMDTMQCLNTAKPISVDQGDAFYGCVLNSCPGAAAQVSNLVRCFYGNTTATCARECADATSDGCQVCLAGACSAEFHSCQASSCTQP
jgi:hypothetical protein